MQNHLTVTIAGQQFSLVADEPEAYMKEIVDLVDQKVAEAKKLVGNTTFSTGVLATLNMADEAVKLRRQCEEYKIKIENQQKELEQRTEALGELSDELETLRHVCPEQAPAKLLTEIRRLERELSDAHNLHETVCAEMDAEVARLNTQIEQLIKAGKEMHEQRVDLEPMQEQIAALIKETERLQQALEKAKAEKEMAMHEQENSMQGEIAQLNAALDALQIKESTQSAAAKGRIDTLTREVEELRAKRTDAETLYAEIKSLQTALDAKEQQVAENAHLKAHIEELTQEIARNDPAPLHAEIENLRHALGMKEQQAAENAQLKAKVSDLGEQLKRNDPAPLYAEIRHLRAALDDCRKQAEDTKRLRDEMDKLRESYHDVRPAVEYEQLNQRFEQVNQELCKAKIQLAGREIGEIGELRRELTRLRELEKEYNEMEKPEELHAEIAYLQEELHKAQQNKPTHHADDMEEIAHLKQQLQQAQSAQSDDEVARLKEEMKHIKSELNRQIQKNQALMQGKKKKGGR